MANTSASATRDHLAGLFADVGLARELWQGAERGRRRQGAWLACVSARGRSPPPHLHPQPDASASATRDHPAGFFADVDLARELWQGAERGRRRQRTWSACVSARERGCLARAIARGEQNDKSSVGLPAHHRGAYTSHSSQQASHSHSHSRARRKPKTRPVAFAAGTVLGA